MNDTDFLTLLMRYQDGPLTPEEAAVMEDALRSDPARRRLFAEAQVRSLLLQERFRQEAFRTPEQSAAIQKARWLARPSGALAAGLAIGLFSASLLWAISTPRATTERLFSLANGDFTVAHLERGFPQQTGLWSGDEAAIEDNRLRFVRPGADAADPEGRALACDMFQLVDLRPLRKTLPAKQEAKLILRARFLDARSAGSKPTVTFIAKLYLFQGPPEELHRTWPLSNLEALASGAGQCTTDGSPEGTWTTVSAECLLPPGAEFVVVQLAARANLRPAPLDDLFADHVELTLKTQSALPVRVVQR